MQIYGFVGVVGLVLFYGVLFYHWEALGLWGFLVVSTIGDCVLILLAELWRRTTLAQDRLAAMEERLRVVEERSRVPEAFGSSSR
jgi:hypothetical protein